MQMNNQKQPMLRRATKLTGACILLPLFISTSRLVRADSANPTTAGIDTPVVAQGASSQKQARKQIKKEQRQLAKLDRKELKKRAEKGERLAQIVLGDDLASEAQGLTFAPAAANDAQSDALAWYALAAKRGYPGAQSLDTSGANFYPVRVIRNK